MKRNKKLYTILSGILFLALVVFYLYTNFLKPTGVNGPVTDPATPIAGDTTSQNGFFNQNAAGNKTVEAERPRSLEIPAAIKRQPETIIKRKGYTVSYNKEWRIPNWVAWHLTAAHTSGDNKRFNMQFTEDTSVPRPRATDNDYYNSRYDRGHMCPSGDNQWDAKAQEQSFLFTNVCPQNHGLNKGDWNDLEIQCRYWARRYGDIYIVTGPIFYHGVQNTIGKNKVAVPDAFFKIILVDKRKTDGIGFVMPNKGKHQNMKSYVRSIDEIEELTGIDFFPLLDDNVEQDVEDQSRRDLIEEWKVWKIKHYEFDDDNRQNTKK